MADAFAFDNEGALVFAAGGFPAEVLATGDSPVFTSFAAEATCVWSIILIGGDFNDGPRFARGCVLGWDEAPTDDLRVRGFVEDGSEEKAEVEETTGEDWDGGLPTSGEPVSRVHPIAPINNTPHKYEIEYTPNTATRRLIFMILGLVIATRQ